MDRLMIDSIFIKNIKRLVLSFCLVCLTSSAFAFSGGSGSPDDPILIAHYPLDGNANDVSGNNYHGSLVNTHNAEDRFGNPNSALSFDGNDYINIGPQFSVGNPGQSHTTTGWFKTKAASVEVILSDYDRPNANDQTFSTQIYFQNGNLINNVRSSGNSYIALDDNFSVDEWHMYASVFDRDSGKLKLYVDGDFLTEGDFDPTLNYNDAPYWRIGKNSWYNVYYKGLLDDIRIYDGVLSEEDIKELFGNYTPNQPPILEIINNLSVIEGDLVKINYTVTDPDNDNISIYFTSPLDQNGEWQTKYGDAGSYNATITVTDGKHNVTETILIQVNETLECPLKDGQIITESITLRPGMICRLPHGLIIGEDSINFDCKGALLDGTGFNDTVGLFGIQGDYVTITNCKIIGNPIKPGSPKPPGKFINNTINKTPRLSVPCIENCSYEWNPQPSNTSSNPPIIVNITREKVNITFPPRPENPPRYDIGTGINLSPIVDKDIIFNCNGAILQGANLTGTAGIYANTLRKVTIKNCIIENYDYNLYLNRFYGGKLINNTLRNPLTLNLQISNTEDALVIENNISQSPIQGFYLKGSNNIVVNNTFYSSTNTWDSEDNIYCLNNYSNLMSKGFLKYY
jgi:parallel beta-helix repeat protein